MHELGITQTLIKLILVECKEHHVESPKVIELELGHLTTYKKDAIMFHYSILKKENKVLKNSNLNIREITGKIFCNDCKKESNLEDPTMIFCQLCDSSEVEIIQGKEFIIKDIVY